MTEQESADSVHGRLKEGAHIAGYSLERALENFEWLLNDERWKELGFDDVNKFLLSVEGAFSQFKLLADQRKSIAKLIDAQSNGAAHKNKIAGVLGVNRETVGKDLGTHAVNQHTNTGKRNKSAGNQQPRTSGVEGSKAAQAAFKDAAPDFYQSSESIEWGTPQWLFDLLDDEFDFELDVCASKENAKCKKFYTKDDDGLSRDWGKRTCWMNPPYGSAIADWMAKARNALKNGATVVCLVPGAYETAWFRESALLGETRLIHNGRVKWRDMTAAPFPSAVIVLSPKAKGGEVEWWDVSP